MRFYLLPISTRQSLLYCHRIASQTPIAQLSWADRITGRAATTWLGWEKKESGWQKKVTTYGNTLFQRLPHEEYSLKGIPPRNPKTADAATSKESESAIIEIEYPKGAINESKILKTLQHLGSEEKQAYHMKWFLGSLVGMPISAPVALLPVIPNLPFFYLCFRAWSHWRARSGSQHLEYLLKNQLTKMSPSPTLQDAYEEATMDLKLKQLQDSLSPPRSADPPPESQSGPAEELLLSEQSGAIIAEHLKIPAVAVEIERAVWQVQRQINARIINAAKNSSEEATKS